MEDENCLQRRKFSWNHIARRKSELSTPTKCKDCEPETFTRCLETSWAETGKNPKALKITNILINLNEKADKTAEKVAAKAEQKIAELHEEVNETQDALEEHLEEEASE